MPVENEVPVSQAQLPLVSSSSMPVQVVAQGKKRLPKKVLFVVLTLLLLGILTFVLVKFILPGVRIGGKTELVWWGLWEDEDIIAPLIEEYEAANPNVSIKYQKNDKEDYRERLSSALARGDGPDIFRIHNSWVPMFAGELAPAPVEVMSSEEFRSTFYQVSADFLVGKEGPLAVPLEYDGLAMFINEEIFAAHGATIPTDWNEVRETARALTIKDERGVITQSGASLGTTSNVDHWPEIIGLLMIQNGADPNRPNDTSGRGRQALGFYKQFAVTDQVWDDTQPSSTIAFAEGRVGMYFGPSWRALEIKERKPSLRFRVVPVPQVPKAEDSSPDITYATFWAEGVSARSKGKEEAWKFLKFLTTRESLTKFYQNVVATREFGEPYSRVDMRELLLSDPLVGGFMQLAPNAKSSFLHSRTFDGVSGINTSLAQYYEDAINAISPAGDARRQMETLAAGVNEVLVRYGLAAPPAAPAR